MSYVHVTGNAIDIGPTSLPGSWQDPEGSTHALPAMMPLELKALGWLSYVHNLPPLAPHQKYEGQQVQVIGTDYVVTEIVVAMSVEEADAADSMQWGDVRAERHGRLLACDWVGNRAVELGVEMDPSWRDYRQALRDVTLQSDPYNIVWPDPPPFPSTASDVARA